MAYLIGQYNKKTGSDDNIFMTLLTNGEPVRITNKPDITGLSSEFEDAGIKVTPSFTANKNYYFHGHILKLSSVQDFTIKLVNYNAQGEQIEQYIKEISIGSYDGSDCQWVDIEFTFTPLSDFDTVLFELKRIAEDYTTEGGRYSVLIYEEISEINNLITSGRLTDIDLRKTSELLKIGVQSHPGFLMCINGEEIRINRTGIYEIKNGLILIPFFSVVAGAKETTDALKDAKDAVQEARDHGESYKDIGSTSILDKPKTREIDNFILDYLYKEEG